MGCVDREECSNGAVAKGQTGRASGEGKQQTLGHELADDSALPGPHGGPHGDFAASAARPDQKQIRYVGAGDEQHQTHRS